jgi:hypothetical protein
MKRKASEKNASDKKKGKARKQPVIVFDAEDEEDDEL